MRRWTSSWVLWCLLTLAPLGCSRLGFGLSAAVDGAREDGAATDVPGAASERRDGKWAGDALPTRDAPGSTDRGSERPGPAADRGLDRLLPLDRSGDKAKGLDQKLAPDTGSVCPFSLGVGGWGPKLALNGSYFGLVTRQGTVQQVTFSVLSSSLSLVVSPLDIQNDGASSSQNQAIVPGPSQQFGVVWDTPKGYFFQLLSPLGVAIGSNVQLSSTLTFAPAIAYNPAGTEFMVAWEKSLARINAQTGAVIASTTSSATGSPALVFSKTSGKYALAYSNIAGTTLSLALLTTTGGSSTVPTTYTPPSTYTIATNSGNWPVTMVWDSTNDRFTVIARLTDSTGGTYAARIEAIRFGSSGALLGSGKVLQGDVGFYEPAVAFNGSGYRILWTDPTANTVNTLLLDASAVPLGSTKVVSCGTSSRLYPDIAWTGSQAVGVWDEGSTPTVHGLPAL
jgi:hypothetical protein